MTAQHDGNNSGQGDISELPPELKGVNWGAFLLNWIWAIGNNTWQGFLVFIPFFGFVMPFVLLFKGNECAWKNNRWQSVDHFRDVQRTWTKWSIIASITVPTLFFGLFYLLFTGISSSMTSSDYYAEALDIVRNDGRVISELGSPIEPGWFITGSVSTSGPSGAAEVAIPLTGSLAEGTAYVIAEKSLGKWTIHELAVEVTNTGRYIEVIQPDSE